MREQVERLTKLTVDLLDLSKLDADAIEIRRERVRLAEVAQPGRRGVRAGRRAPRLRDRGRATRTATAAAADPDRVAQIMRILIDNALTHTPEGTAISVGATKRRTDRQPWSSPTTGPGSSRARASASSSASTPATRSAAPASGWRSPASWRCGWAASLELRSRRGRTAFELRLPAAARWGLSLMRRLRSLAVARSLIAASLGLAACGDEESTVDRRPKPPTADRGRAATSRRVVIEAADGAFDAQTIYENAAPGVVTVTSIFGERRRRRTSSAAAAARGRARAS